LEDKEISPV